MRQNRDQFQPKPRPRGFSSNDRPFPARPRRPEPDARPRVRKPPMIIPSKDPASGKERRRMLKAAAWRLARIVHSKPAALVAMGLPDLLELIDKKCGRVHTYGGDRGDALRLTAKIKRLRQPA
jgi:hypothetical protein